MTRSTTLSVAVATLLSAAGMSSAGIVYSTINTLPSTIGQSAAGHRSQPNTMQPPPANSYIWDDINIDDETTFNTPQFMFGQSHLLLESITIAVVQQPGAASTTVNLAMAETIAGTGTNPPSINAGTVQVIGSQTIPAWPNGNNPVARTIVVNFAIAPFTAIAVNYADQPGYGQFALGVSFGDVGPNNLWAISDYNAPGDSELNLDLYFENNYAPLSLEYGGEEVHATFAVQIEGTPVPEPTALGVIGLGALTLLRRRRSA
ncbi:MAG TPA: PEP-CTERM sorting domain-containing protein [Tepidisphaeraceae bacterium]|nr:PEP-CTERM sorting domain-containing protein [Tepidisphaeraceae bacterium]